MARLQTALLVIIGWSYPLAALARDFVPDKQGAEILRAIIADDARAGILENGNSGFNYTSWVGPYIKASAAEIGLDYLQDRAAADQKYATGLTVFSGRLSAVKKDAYDRPYIVMQSSEAFREIQARMDDDPATLDALPGGSDIDLVCKDIAFGALAPVFLHCLLRQTFARSEAEKVADAAVAWLTEGTVPVFLAAPEDRTKAFGIYYAGSKIRNARPCLGKPRTLDACAGELRSIDLTGPEFDFAERAAAADLGLPARAVPAPPAGHE